MRRYQPVGLCANKDHTCCNAAVLLTKHRMLHRVARHTCNCLCFLAMLLALLTAIPGLRLQLRSLEDAKGRQPEARPFSSNPSLNMAAAGEIGDSFADRGSCKSALRACGTVRSTGLIAWSAQPAQHSDKPIGAAVTN